MISLDKFKVKNNFISFKLIIPSNDWTTLLWWTLIILQPLKWYNFLQWTYQTKFQFQVVIVLHSGTNKKLASIQFQPFDDRWAAPKQPEPGQIQADYDINFLAFHTYFNIFETNIPECQITSKNE